MLRRWASALTVAGAVAAAVLVSVPTVPVTAAELRPAAQAPPPGSGDTRCDALGRCRLAASEPGVPGARSGASGADEPPRGAGTARGPQCRSGGTPIPCSVSGGYWNSGFGCYVSPQAVDPIAAGFPAEQIAARAGQSLHQCVPYNLVEGGRGIPAQGFYRWLAAGTPAAAIVDPEVLARTAVERMDLQPVTVGLAPPMGSLALVGLPVHMWAAGGDEDWRDTAIVAAGPVRVTAQAEVGRVTWDMGDGTVVTCGRGTPYDPARGAAPSPDCGHVYTRTSAGRPGLAYPVTATSHWRVTWTSSTGAGGVIEVEVSASASLRVGESQVVVVGG